ncbi:hypothetical protein TNIN_154821 [Trichonephila inaurata madagascariensis]|uniref:Uncharacterized protein n=1 Tax=Trichonephila inaurata madagascariensis TaxID=2747483 RepID=A0A8X6J6U0_9ARAC|nr:hypothetical protein TNIN_154821 [Trichonephila inaurata madagascariensis]
MGGKKKTKWRKLPLAEFTKECTSTQDVVPKQDCKPDHVNTTKDEETPPFISPYEELAVNTNQCNYEYGEYTDGKYD